jgi:CheY-like chemotaxis protein
LLRETGCDLQLNRVLLRLVGLGKVILMASVMVVDDDPDVLATLSAILERAGHTVTRAASGVAALSLLDEGKFADLLLTDVVMPGLNGFNLARMVHLRRPSTRVLYLTGYHEAAMAMKDVGEKLGKLLTKPILPELLRSEVLAALSGGEEAPATA